MGRLARLKRKHIEESNRLLEKGHRTLEVKKEIKLNPSDNVTKNSDSFVNKMNNLTEDEDIGGMTSDPRVMKKEYEDKDELTPDPYAGWRYSESKQELSPTQQAVHDDVMAYIGQTFASWMSPSSPPFSQEYAKGPHWEDLSRGIRNIVTHNVE